MENDTGVYENLKFQMMQESTRDGLKMTFN